MKTRQKLIGEENLKRYLIFAIGEVLLVTIGILLALQVDNLNEERKSILQGKEYIHQIYLDLQEDIDNLSDNIDVLENQYQKSVKFLEFIENTHGSISDYISVYESIGPINHSVSVERSKNTWDGLENAGNTYLLRNDSLVNLLTKYYNRYDFLISHFNQVPYKSREKIREYVVGTFSSVTIRNFHDNKNWNMPESEVQKIIHEWTEYPEFTTLLAKIAVTSAVNKNYFSRLRDQAQTIQHHLVLLTEETKK